MTQAGLRIGFAGTPELATTVLERVLGAGRHTVSIVYTQPDRPAGRGRRPRPSPVKQLALQYGLRVEQPQDADHLDPQGLLHETDVLLVAAFGLMLPPGILKRPRAGAINVHTSLLPRWRGAAPVQRAIQAGDSQTGITIMQMDAGLDTGPILLQQRCAILPDDTSGSLFGRLADLGAACALEALDLLTAGQLTPIPQDPSLATVARKITKDEARLDWHGPAALLERTVRAFNPWPICHTQLDGTALRVWRAALVNERPPAQLSAPGTVCDFSAVGVDVATGSGILRLTELQLPGRRPVPAQDFFNANRGWLRPGMVAV